VRHTPGSRFFMRSKYMRPTAKQHALAPLYWAILTTNAEAVCTLTHTQCREHQFSDNIVVSINNVVSIRSEIYQIILFVQRSTHQRWLATVK
jgi:hypothetical protein